VGFRLIGDVALVPSAEPLPLARDLTQPPVCSLFTDQRGKWRGIAPSGTRFRFRIRYPDFLAERVGDCPIYILYNTIRVLAFVSCVDCSTLCSSSVLERLHTLPLQTRREVRIPDCPPYLRQEVQPVARTAPALLASAAASRPVPVIQATPAITPKRTFERLARHPCLDNLPLAEDMSKELPVKMPLQCQSRRGDASGRRARCSRTRGSS